MGRKKHIEPTNGVLTDRMDVNSPEFDQFQAILLNKSRAQTDSQKKKIELVALRIQMEDYLNSKEKNKIKLAGNFLKSCLDILNIRQNRFAHYIGIGPSNLSKIIKGERPINYEIALVLEEIFELDAMLWLEIQSKNELIKLVKNKAHKKYSLKELIKVNA